MEKAQVVRHAPWAIPAFIAVVIYMAILWLQHAALRNRPTWSQTREMIAREAPYTRDRDGIFMRLEELESIETRIVGSIKDNSMQVRKLGADIEARLVVKPSDVLDKLEHIQKLLEKNGVIDG